MSVESMRRALEQRDFALVVRLLRSAGPVVAEVHLNNAWRDNILTCAAAHGAVDALTKALDCGVSPDKRDSRGYTPLHVAAESDCAPAAALLVLRGAAVDARTNLGATPLAVAASNGSLPVVTFLLSRGANTLICDSLGTTPLHAAAVRSHYDVAQEILRVDAGRSLDVKDENGTTALHCAARYGHFRVVELLHQSGAICDSVDFQGWSPVMSAARFGHLKVVEFLYNCKVDIGRKCKSGRTALDNAELGQHKRTAVFLKDAHESGGLNTREIQELRERKEDTEKLKRAVESGDWKSISQGLDNHGPSMLSSSCVVKAVIAHRSTQGTVLHRAAYSYDGPHVACAVSGLLEWSGVSSLVDVTRDHDGSSALQLSLRMGQSEIAELLLKHRASVATTDNNGDSPLSIAVRFNKDQRLLNILLLLGASMNHKNNDGLRPVDIAERSGNREAANLLRSWSGRARNSDACLKSIGFAFNLRTTLLSVLRGDLVMTSSALANVLSGGLEGGGENCLGERLWIAHSLIMLGFRSGVLDEYQSKGLNGRRHFLMEVVYTHAYKVLRNNPDGAWASYVRKILSQAEDLQLIKSAEAVYTTALLARDVRNDFLQVGAAMQSIFNEVCLMQRATWQKLNSIDTLSMTFAEALRDLSKQIFDSRERMKRIEDRLSTAERDVTRLEDAQEKTAGSLRSLQKNIRAQDRARKVALCGKLVLSIIPIAGHFLGHAVDAGTELFYAVGASELTKFAAKMCQTGAEIAIDEFTAVDVANFELLETVLSPAFANSLEEPARKEFQEFINNAITQHQAFEGDLDMARREIRSLRFYSMKRSSNQRFDCAPESSLPPGCTSDGISQLSAPNLTQNTGKMQSGQRQTQSGAGHSHDSRFTLSALKSEGLSAASVENMNRKELSYAIAAYMLGYDEDLAEKDLENLQKVLLEIFCENDVVGSALVGECAWDGNEFVALILEGLRKDPRCNASKGKEILLKKLIRGLSG